MRHVPLASFAIAVSLTSAFGVTIAASPAAAATIFSTAAPQATQADLGRALGADGTFHGAPGVAGAVDPNAWRLVSDLSAGGAPRFVPASSSAQAPFAGPWSALGSNGFGDGALNGQVEAIAISGTDLYVGGNFTNAGGIAGANFIAKWDGIGWSAMGAAHSLNDQVQALAISGNVLYAGGRFTNAAGIGTADFLARWNGHTWSGLGSNGSGNGALGDWVQALAVDGSNLDVGGFFTNAGGVATADYVARWNGSAWSGLGSDGSGGGAIAPSPDAPSPAVFALAISGSDLFVGGSFINVAGIQEADDMAGWNGSAWFAMGSGDVNNGGGAVESAVYALVVSGTDLYAGGAFTDVGTLAGDYVAKWDGSAWSALGTGSPDGGAIWNGNVYALAISGTDLFVGGDFYDAAGIPAADRIARWDGAAWNALGSGGPDGGALDGTVYALGTAISGADLFVGGAYWDTLGDATADYIDLWGPPVVVARPDGRIRLGTGAYVGNDLYNTTGKHQSRTGSALRGHTITFGLSIQNDGTDPDSFFVKATGRARTAYRVKYFSGTNDITAAVVAGTFETTTLATGATFGIKAEVTVRSTAAAGSSVTRLVTLTSAADGSKADAVKFTGKLS